MKTLFLTVSFLAFAWSAEQGQRITARDGDTIVVDDDAYVRVVRQRKAYVRLIFNPAQRWLIVLADYARAGAPPDGLADDRMHFRDVEGDWPLGERWQGEAAFEEYAVPGSGGPQGYGLRVPEGFVQLLGMGGPRGHEGFRDQGALAIVTFRGSGRGGFGLRGVPFDEAEQTELANMARNAGSSSVTTFVSGRPPGTIVGETSMSVSMTPGAPPSPQAPVRVGGTIGAPRKVHDVAPVMPETARRAGVFGIVILEITIAADGSVSRVQVLRSIPLLDRAAIEAAQQWRFEPTLLNGMPVPVIMTATVSFN